MQEERFPIPLILASASPRRQGLLGQLVRSFLVEASGVEESGFEQLSPAETAVELARRKALEVSSRLLYGLVVAADTLIDLEGKALGKPESIGHARRMLEQLRGRNHRVVTGLAVYEIESRRMEATSVATHVGMRSFPDWELDAYLESGEPLDKAGAYAIQRGGGKLIDGIDGCYNNVVGLPLCELWRLISRFPVALEPGAGESCRLPGGQPCPRLRAPKGDERA